MTPFLYLARSRDGERNQTPQHSVLRDVLHLDANQPTSLHCPIAIVPEKDGASTGEFNLAVWDGLAAAFNDRETEAREGRGERQLLQGASREIPNPLPAEGDALPTSGDALALAKLLALKCSVPKFGLEKRRQGIGYAVFPILVLQYLPA